MLAILQKNAYTQIIQSGEKWGELAVECHSIPVLAPKSRKRGAGYGTADGKV